MKNKRILTGIKELDDMYGPVMRKRSLAIITAKNRENAVELAQTMSLGKKLIGTHTISLDNYDIPRSLEEIGEVFDKIYKDIEKACYGNYRIIIDIGKFNILFTRSTSIVPTLGTISDTLLVPATKAAAMCIIRALELCKTMNVDGGIILCISLPELRVPFGAPYMGVPTRFHYPVEPYTLHGYPQFNPMNNDIYVAPSIIYFGNLILNLDGNKCTVIKSDVIKYGSTFDLGYKEDNSKDTDSKFKKATQAKVKVDNIDEDDGNASYLYDGNIHESINNEGVADTRNIAILQYDVQDYRNHLHHIATVRSKELPTLDSIRKICNDSGEINDSFSVLPIAKDLYRATWGKSKAKKNSIKIKKL